MDEFKKYLKSQETDLDLDVPGSDLWKGISERSAVVNIRGNSSRPVLAYAIAASLILVAGFGIFKFISTPQGSADFVKEAPVKIEKLLPIDTPVQAVATVKPIKIYRRARMSKPHSIIGDEYTQLIERRIDQVRAMPVYAESPSYFSTFSAQLKQMTKDESDIKKDIYTYGLNDDELLEQLIHVNEQKLRLLKGLQAEINKMNKQVRSNQHPADSARPYFLKL